MPVHSKSTAKIPVVLRGKTIDIEVETTSIMDGGERYTAGSVTNGSALVAASGRDPKRVWPRLSDIELVGTTKELVLGEIERRVLRALDGPTQDGPTTLAIATSTDTTFALSFDLERKLVAIQVMFHAPLRVAQMQMTKAGPSVVWRRTGEGGKTAEIVTGRQMTKITKKMLRPEDDSDVRFARIESAVGNAPHSLPGILTDLFFDELDKWVEEEQAEHDARIEKHRARCQQELEQILTKEMAKKGPQLIVPGVNASTAQVNELIKKGHQLPKK